MGLVPRVLAILVRPRPEGLRNRSRCFLGSSQGAEG